MEEIVDLSSQKNKIQVMVMQRLICLTLINMQLRKSGCM